MNISISQQDFVLVVNRDVVRLLVTVNSVLRRYKEGASMSDGVAVIGTEIFRSFIKEKLKKMNSEAYMTSDTTIFDKLCNPKIQEAMAQVVSQDIWSPEFEKTAQVLSDKMNQDLKDVDSEIIDLVVKLKDHKKLFAHEDRVKINQTIKAIYEAVDTFLKTKGKKN